MAEENTITTVFRADISQFSASAQSLNQYVRQVNSQFAAATAGMGNWADNADGLRAKIAQLNGTLAADKKRLSDLTAQYEAMKAAGKENTYEAKQLQIAINNQVAKVKKAEKQTEDYTDELKKLEAAGVSTKQELEKLTATQEKQGKSAGNVAGKIAKGLGAGIAAVGATAVGAVGGFLALAESTRDYRQNLNQLETAFGKVGLSAEETYEAFNYFGSVLGDTRKAKETLLVLGQLVDSEKELEEWTDTLTGVYATFGEAIPLEAMSEAIVAASRDAVATGGLAEALQNGGVNIEEFNAQLAALNSDEERSAHIQQTLNGIYGEAAKQYNEMNKDILDASTAQTNLENAMAKLGAVAEPIMTMLKNATAGFVEALGPFISLLGEGLKGAFEGTADGAKKFSDGLSGIVKTILQKATELLPRFVDIIAQLIPSVIQTLANALPTIINAVVQGVVTLVNSVAEMLPTLIPVIIDGILQAAEAILDNLDVIIDAGIELVMALADGLIAALPRLIDKIPVIIDKLITAITNNLPKLISAGIELTIKLSEGIMQATPQLIAKIPEIIASLVQGFVIDGVPQMLNVGVDLIKGVWEGIKSMGKWLGDQVKGFFGGITDTIKGFFGIHSPSTLFKNEIGKNLALGVGEGFTGEMKDVEKEMTASMRGLAPALQIDPTIAPITGGSDWVSRLAEVLENQKGGDTINNYSFDYRFEKMATSRLAIHQAALETKRIVGGAT